MNVIIDRAMHNRRGTNISVVAAAATRNSRSAQLWSEPVEYWVRGRGASGILMGKVKSGRAIRCRARDTRMRDATVRYLPHSNRVYLPCFRSRHVQRHLAKAEGLLPRCQRQSHQDRLGARRQQQGGIGGGALVR